MEFKQYLTERHQSGTVKRYLWEIELFLVYCNKTGLDPKTAVYSDIVQYIQQVRQGSQDVKIALFSLKKYYKYLVYSKVRKDNPAQAVKLKDQRSDIQLQDLFSTEELELLLERTERYPILKNRNKIIISLLIYQGLTNGEICRIQLQDIDLEEGIINVLGSHRTEGRQLKLQSKQVYWLMEYIKTDREVLLKRKSSQLIISLKGSEEKGEGVGYLLETYRSLFPDRKLNAKTIRQSVIANLLKSGKDTRMVQRFAGHRFPGSTEKYKQTGVEELKLAVLKYHPLG